MNQLSDEDRPDNSPYTDMRLSRALSILSAIARFVFLLTIACVAAGGGSILGIYLYFTKDLPSVDILKNYSPPIVSCFYDDKGQVIAEFAKERRFVVSAEEIPDLLKKAFVAAEDKNFLVHRGVHEDAIIRAIKMNLMRGKLRGCGSTITQQAAKTFLLSTDQKFSRKIKETILSVRIDRSLTKEQILYLYLNQIFLGSGAYGVEAAARTYFDKHVKDLTIAECAMLGGLAKSPSGYSPLRNLQRALERRSYVSQENDGRPLHH